MYCYQPIIRRLNCALLQPSVVTRHMCEAFKQGKDIHTATAAKVFNVEEKDVTKEMRYKAKSVNFGIIYGQGAFGLADNLGISRTEAKEIIDNYKKQFSDIQKYMDDTINFAREHGYVQTLMGRKTLVERYQFFQFYGTWFCRTKCHQLTHTGHCSRYDQTGNDKNSPGCLRKNKFQSKMILQVHDELVFDAIKEEVEIIKPIILNVCDWHCLCQMKCRLKLKSVQERTGWKHIKRDMNYEL